MDHDAYAGPQSSNTRLCLSVAAMIGFSLGTRKPHGGELSGCQSDAALFNLRNRCCNPAVSSSTPNLAIAKLTYCPYFSNPRHTLNCAILTLTIRSPAAPEATECGGSAWLMT